MGAVAWREEVLEERRLCANCGAQHRLVVRPIVPFRQGGKQQLSNATVVCRDCDILRVGPLPAPAPKNRRLANFWVSAQFHQDLTATLELGYGGVRTVASLCRNLVAKYVADPDAYDDVGGYQDRGMGVKITFQVDADDAEELKAVAQTHTLSMTDALKGLIMLYIERVGSISKE